MYYKKILAELIGTFLIVFLGTGAIVIHEQTGLLNELYISLIFGCTVLLMVWLFGNVSGAHFNPAVTVAFYVSRKIKARLALSFIVMQFAGGLLASLALRSFVNRASLLGVTLPSYSLVTVIVTEVVLTCMLMLVILIVSHGSKEEGFKAAVFVGLAITLGAIIGGPISGGSMNPARSFGPALIAGNCSGLWIYLTAPFAGSVTAVKLHALFSNKKDVVLK